MSSEVKAKNAKIHNSYEHETKVKEEGSERRNITRKKGSGSTQLYDNRNKKQGGSG